MVEPEEKLMTGSCLQGDVYLYGSEGNGRWRPGWRGVSYDGFGTISWGWLQEPGGRGSVCERGGGQVPRIVEVWVPYEDRSRARQSRSGQSPLTDLEKEEQVLRPSKLQP